MRVGSESWAIVDLLDNGGVFQTGVPKSGSASAMQEEALSCPCHDGEEEGGL